MKYVYDFSEGKKEMKASLGGKGANLAEMTNMGIPVPFGFTLTTEACAEFYRLGEKYPEGVDKEIDEKITLLEKKMGAKLGDADDPLLVSVRSGAAVSMPGMMDTVLNLGLNDQSVLGLAKKSGERFAFDAYRRFIQMFGDVVMGVEHSKFEAVLDNAKETKGVEFDTDLDESDMKKVVEGYKEVILKEKGESFPQDPKKQLQMSIDAVFGSWNNPRAISYRRINDIKGLVGTAVNVQAMVFGNMGETSGTGVCFSRDPSTGENVFYGEYLMNAQGEDVVAGIRTPKPLADLEKQSPELYKELCDIKDKLEKHYKDMQDMEFTIQEGKLYMLQTRSGKRTAHAALKNAVDMVNEGLIDEKTAILRVEPNQLDQLLHKQLDPVAVKEKDVIARGLPASPGAAVGQIVFTAEKATEFFQEGKKVILARTETSPEDIEGMNAAQGILTSRGGMTCIAGDSLVLTNKGFISAEKAHNLINEGEELQILSYNSDEMKSEWKPVIATGKRKSKTIKITTSQTGKAEHSCLRITEDHKMYTFDNRRLIKKKLGSVLESGDSICVLEKIPELEAPISNKKLSYLAGALFTDGYINLRETKGSVTFIQKPSFEKSEFIETVHSYFSDVFNENFNFSRIRHNKSELRGRQIEGTCLDLICTKMAPALALTRIQQNIVQWVLSLDTESTLSFLAGVIDGDGSYYKNRIQIFASKDHIIRGVIVSCLKLGIVPQLTTNRDIYNIQILENIDKILSYTKRVKGQTTKRIYGTKFFAAKQLFSDVTEIVNKQGRIRERIKRNLLIDGDKIKENILPLCNEKLEKELSRVLNSNLRMYRVEKKDNLEEEYVYNFEVDSDKELDKNYVVFTNMYTPLLISNSHAAVVARGMGTCCVAGCGDARISEGKKTLTIGGKVFKEGDYITLNGSTGEIYDGKIPVVDPEIGGDFSKLMEWADKYRKLGVRTNADTPKDSEVAIKYGAEGIGLCRTEHMFFEGDRIKAMREMILSKDVAGRKTALNKLLPYQKADFKGLFEVMEEKPVTIRLLDPPLHEFLPTKKEDIEGLSKEMGVSVEDLKQKISDLHEFNPMLGHRGCRLGVTYPEITEMQTRAIIEAAAEVKKENGLDVVPEIMIPLIGHVAELKHQKEIVVKTAGDVLKEMGVEMDYKVGTMIEVPRGALTADEVAKEAEFFSFGTNDLTQMGLGFSRDDAGNFISEYIEKGIYEKDPFQVLDQAGVGELVRIAVEKGRKTRPDLKLGICGEHGGDPSSVEFCHRTGLNYVSCSPYRVPIARLAAAHAVLKE